MLIQAFQDDKVPAELNSLDQLYAVLDGFETCTFSPAEYMKIASAALKWLHSLEGSTASSSAGILHQVMGCYLFSTGDLARLPAAIAYLTRSSDMDSVTDALWAASKVCFSKNL